MRNAGKVRNASKCSSSSNMGKWQTSPQDNYTSSEGMELVIWSAIDDQAWIGSWGRLTWFELGCPGAKTDPVDWPDSSSVAQEQKLIRLSSSITRSSRGGVICSNSTSDLTSLDKGFFFRYWIGSSRAEDSKLMVEGIEQAEGRLSGGAYNEFRKRLQTHNEIKSDV